MIVSRVVFGTLVAAFAFTAVGCQVTVKTKTRYTDDTATAAAPTDWAGGLISINVLGVGASVNGGVKVNSDPAATKVTATARLLAMAFTESDAKLSLADAKASFTITVDGTTTNVVCNHGNTHGDSNSGESGCELATITVPAGTADRPLTLKVLSGNGDMTLQLANATITELGTNAGGSGDIIASLPATKGGTISLVSQQAGDITATMPPSFAADEIVLLADSDQIANAFADAKVGASNGGRGAVGTGLKLLKLTSTSFAGSTGKITLQ